VKREEVAVSEARHLAPVAEPFSAARARELTDEVKVRAEELWRLLLDLYEHDAHGALGYRSWAAYCESEFGTTQPRAYQLLDAGRVARAIEGRSTKVERPSERVARQLAPVLRSEGEEAAVQVYEEAVERHGPRPTARQVRAVVHENPEPRLSQRQERIGRALRSIEDTTDYLATILGDPDSFAVDAPILTAWREQATHSRDTLTRLIRRTRR
jgi:hypothetical protein